MEPATTLELIAALGPQSNRASAGRTLAARLGAEDLLLFVRDPDLETLIPAPGFPQTLRGGRTWRSFLEQCSRTDQCAGEVELPAGSRRTAVAFSHGAATLILLGGNLRPSEIPLLHTLMPLLASLLCCEQDAKVARDHVADAKDSVSRAQTLSAALEAARANASGFNAELRAQDRHKDQFLATLGHELRNPLSALTSTIELLKRSRGDVDFPARTMQIMERQIHQLTRLVNDLLDVSRVSRGRIDLHRENIPLADVLREALEENHPLLEDRKHTAILQLGEPLTVYGDRVRLAQVFGNLINNAAKYTAHGGTVSVTIARAEKNAVVQIRDNGSGISAEMLPRIFDLFAQAQTTIDRARGGLGIGLTLVRTLVDLHGGRVTAQSEGIGRGTTVSVSLPLAIHDEMKKPSPCRENAAELQQLNVLVVDDNRDAADSIAELLGLLGQSVAIAYDGTEALERAREKSFDLILLDIGLPDIDGYEVARQLRSTKLCGARIVALTGFGIATSEARSRETEFDERAVKPVSMDALQEILARTSPH